MANFQTGKVYIHKQNEIRLISPEQITEYLEQGWKLGSKDSKRCHIHKDGVYKNIYTIFLPDYLKAGWTYGAAGKPRKNKNVI